MFFMAVAFVGMPLVGMPLVGMPLVGILPEYGDISRKRNFKIPLYVAGGALQTVGPINIHARQHVLFALFGYAKYFSAYCLGV